jgi:hypothetical protein
MIAIVLAFSLTYLENGRATILCWGSQSGERGMTPLPSIGSIASAGMLAIASLLAPPAYVSAEPMESAWNFERVGAGTLADGRLDLGA